MLTVDFGRIFLWNFWMRKNRAKILVMNGICRIWLQKNRPFAIIFGFIPLAVPRWGFSPHIPAPRLFVLFHPSIHPSIQSPPSHPKKRNIPYWYCLQWTPSLTLAPSSLKCLQNYNPNIHRKCFGCSKCFRCSGCFISLLDHKTARFWSKSELNPKNRHPPASPI